MKYNVIGRNFGRGRCSPVACGFLGAAAGRRLIACIASSSDAHSSSGRACRFAPGSARFVGPAGWMG